MTLATIEPRPVAPPPHRRRRRALIMLIKITIAVAACVWLGRLLRGVDWQQVASALGSLTVLQSGVLLVLLAVRQVLNAVPIASFVAPLGLQRAVICDLSSGVVSTTAPPPSDVLLRFSMFKSWGVDWILGSVGLSLSSIVTYFVRFAAPVLAFFLFLTFDGYDVTYLIVAIVCGIIAVAIAVAMVLVLRKDSFAAWFGLTAGTLAHRLRPDRVDPQKWSAALVDFRMSAAERARARGALAVLAMFGLVLVEGVMLTLTMRFMGLPASQLTFAEIMAGLLCAYPLTCLPFAGMGILDSALLGFYTYRGASDEPTVIAAILVWRVATFLVPLFVGMVTLMIWRRSNPEEARQARTAARTGQPLAAEAPVPALQSSILDDAGIPEP